MAHGALVLAHGRPLGSLEQSVARLGPAVPPWSFFKAPPRAPVSLRLPAQVGHLLPLVAPVRLVRQARPSRARARAYARALAHVHLHVLGDGAHTTLLHTAHA